MDITNAKAAFIVKQVAKNVSGIVKQKAKVKEQMDKIEEKYKKVIEDKLAKLKAEYESLTAQQEIFEAPIRKLTGGFGTEDLVTTEKVASGTNKDGKTTYTTKYVLKYPETIVPPAEVPTEEGTPEEAGRAEIPVAPESNEPVDFEPKEEDDDDLPFGN